MSLCIRFIIIKFADDMTAGAKAHVVCTKIEFKFTDTLNIYPSPVYQMLNVNWCAFVEDILPTLQSHDSKSGTNGGH